MYLFVKEGLFGFSYRGLVGFPVFKVSILSVHIEAIRALLIPLFLGVSGDALGFGESCPGVFV